MDDAALSQLATTTFPLIHAKDESEDLASKVLELQDGLLDLLKRVRTVHDEHNKKQDENLMLQQYIANLMNSTVWVSS